MQLRKLFDIQMKSKLILKDFLLVPYFVSHLICRWNEMGMMKSNLILKDFLLVPYFVSHLICRWNEMGMYDIPAELEYIFKVTGRQKLLYIGHSMGKYIYRDVLSLCKGQ
jgi:hypothetical protein